MDKTLVELLEDAIAIIEAAEIEDSEHWLGQARAALDRREVDTLRPLP